MAKEHIFMLRYYLITLITMLRGNIFSLSEKRLFFGMLLIESATEQGKGRTDGRRTDEGSPYQRPTTKLSGRKIIFMPPSSMSDVAPPTDMIMSWTPTF